MKPGVLRLSEDWHKARNNDWVKLSEAVLFKPGVLGRIAPIVSVQGLSPELFPLPSVSVAHPLLPVELKSLDGLGDSDGQILEVFNVEHRPEVVKSAGLSSNEWRHDQSWSERIVRDIVNDTESEVPNDHEAGVKPLFQDFGLSVLFEPLADPNIVII